MWIQASSIREDDERGWTLPLSCGILCALLVLILKVAFGIISLTHKMMEKSSRIRITNIYCVSQKSRLNEQSGNVLLEFTVNVLVGIHKSVSWLVANGQAQGSKRGTPVIGQVLKKNPRKWQKCNLVSGHSLCGQQHGLAMNWVDRPCTSTDERDERAVVIVCGLLQGLVVFSLTFRFFVNSHLDHSRAWIPACSLTAALAAPLLSLQSFYNYARGHCEAARSFFRAMHSVHLISVEQ